MLVVRGPVFPQVVASLWAAVEHQLEDFPALSLSFVSPGQARPLEELVVAFLRAFALVVLEWVLVDLLKVFELPVLVEHFVALGSVLLVFVVLGSVLLVFEQLGEPVVDLDAQRLWVVVHGLPEYFVVALLLVFEVPVL